MQDILTEFEPKEETHSFDAFMTLVMILAIYAIVIRAAYGFLKGEITIEF